MNLAIWAESKASFLLLVVSLLMNPKELPGLFAGGSILIFLRKFAGNQKLNLRIRD